MVGCQRCLLRRRYEASGLRPLVARCKGSLSMVQGSRTGLRLESRLRKLLTPVFVVAADRRLVFFNAGCEELTGVSAQDVLGRRCAAGTSGDLRSVESVLQRLCPPAEAFQGRHVHTAAFFLPRSGPRVARVIDFYPLRDATNAITYVLGVIRPAEQARLSREVSPLLQVHAELHALRVGLRERYGIDSIVASGPAMRRVVRQVQLAARTNTPVMLVGERGSGKTFLARTIHYASAAHNRAFVALDAERIPPEELEPVFRQLFESDQLERMAETLRPASVFIGHLTRLPRELQAHLANRMDKSPETRVRWMAGVDEPLQCALDEERLHPELYYALSAVVIDIPPLRERIEDVPLLAQQFLEAAMPEYPEVTGFDPAVLEEWKRYNWPGNVRELELVVTEAIRQAGKGAITAESLPFRYRTGRDAQAVGPRFEPQPFDLTAYVEDLERQAIRWALTAARGNKSKAAELLKMNRPRFYRKLAALGMLDEPPTSDVEPKP
ncbi:MAG: PAS domain-containing protein [Planctomycetota bacterium]|nr:MAG: PAS domain-containing protein [Planctomycetota bacterium]